VWVLAHRIDLGKAHIDFDNSVSCDGKGLSDFLAQDNCADSMTHPYIVSISLGIRELEPLLIDSRLHIMAHYDLIITGLKSMDLTAGTEEIGLGTVSLRNTA